MNNIDVVLRAAVEVQFFCAHQNWQFCFIGGLAVQRWGMPRFTQDVDLTLLTGFGGEHVFVDALLKHFKPRLSNARQFALEHRVLLARTATGVDLDFSLGAFPFEEQSIERATPWRVNESISLKTCSAEDLVIHKTFAARDRDWADIETILVRQHGKLDLTRIRRELPQLLELKQDSEAMTKLEKMIERVDNRLS